MNNWMGKTFYGGGEDIDLTNATKDKDHPVIKALRKFGQSFLKPFSSGFSTLFGRIVGDLFGTSFVGKDGKVNWK
jgi:hypothetical protein